MATNQGYPPPSTSSLSFTQGFLLGQLTVAVLLFAFIKFFILGEPPNADARASDRANQRRQRTLRHQRSISSNRHPALRHKRSSVLRNPPLITPATILAKTYYNVNGHQPESLDWFNVLIAQTIAQFRADARHDDAIVKSLTTVLNGSSKPDYVGDIRITEISLGEEYPIFSNCRVIPVEEGGLGSTISGAGDGTGEKRLQARIDVDLSDVITLGVETTLVLNYPRPRVAVLPVALSVSVVRFSGTLSLSFIPSASTNPSTPPATTLAFTFLDDYRLDLSVRSLLGSRARLTDIPKIAMLVESRLHAWFDDRAVEPRFQQIVLPSLWPRKKNTRGGEEVPVSPPTQKEPSLPTPTATPTPEASLRPPDMDDERGRIGRGVSYSSDRNQEVQKPPEDAKLRDVESQPEVRHSRPDIPVRDDRDQDSNLLSPDQALRWRAPQRAGFQRDNSWNAGSSMPGSMPGGMMP